MSSIFAGLLCSIIGIVVIIMECVHQESMAAFFGTDITMTLDEYYVGKSELIQAYLHGVTLIICLKGYLKV